MGKGKKGGKRMSKKQLADALTTFFTTQPNETFTFKQIFRALHLDTHPLKMLALDTMEEMAWDDVLSKVDDLVSWANDIKEYALQAAVSGKTWTGYKLVEGRSVRKFTDDKAVAATLLAAGYDPYEKKLISMTEMQKQLGKAKFQELLGSLIIKPQGKPTLVPASDNRPELNTAKADFKE